MLWVLKGTVPKHMLNMGKKIFINYAKIISLVQTCVVNLQDISTNLSLYLKALWKTEAGFSADLDPHYF